MIRYARQYDSFRCAPIAILNVLKWLERKEFRGEPVNLELARTTLSRMAKTDEEGTETRAITKLLRRIPGITVRHRVIYTAWDVASELIDNEGTKVAIVLADGDGDHTHVFLVTAYDRYSFTTVNWDGYKAKQKIAYERMMNRIASTEPQAEIWVITRKK